MQASTLITQRMTAKMHRQLVATAPGRRDCGYHLLPIADKTHHKPQMVHPVPATVAEAGQCCCQPYGRIDDDLGCRQPYPVSGEDFAYQIFRQEELLCRRGTETRAIACGPPARFGLLAAGIGARPGAALARRRRHRAVNGRPTPSRKPIVSTSTGAAAPREPAVDRPSTDIEALARAGARLRQHSPNRPATCRFASSSPWMPRASLQKLLTDRGRGAAARSPCRGPEGEPMRETAAVSSLIGERQGGVGDRPEAFARHRIERAPTFVLSLDDRADRRRAVAATAARRRTFVSVSGDVSLDHARWTRWPGSARSDR